MITTARPSVLPAPAVWRHLTPNDGLATMATFNKQFDWFCGKIADARARLCPEFL